MRYALFAGLTTAGNNCFFFQINFSEVNDIGIWIKRTETKSKSTQWKIFAL